MYNINWANQYEVMCVCLNNYGGISIREPIISRNEIVAHFQKYDYDVINCSLD